jgi:N-methylhydantoinase B/oxoprolinase/acetone carboxylase alpha subunit
MKYFFSKSGLIEHKLCMNNQVIQSQVILWLFYLQMRQLGSTLKPGDVILSNHPQAGGSHLPDLTVITPVSFL